jgi:hypothetical protein
LLFSVCVFHQGVERFFCGRLISCPIGSVGQQEKLRPFSATDELIPADGSRDWIAGFAYRFLDFFGAIDEVVDAFWF